MSTPGNTLFGTDGIRGRFGHPPLDVNSLEKLGRAMARILGSCRIIIGEDPRVSSSEIRKKLLSGMSSLQTVDCCGVIPTPGLSWLVRSGNYDWGIMITASHNPWMDNGIKLFARNGRKAPDDLESRISAEFLTSSTARENDGNGARIVPDPVGDGYADALAEWGAPLSGSQIRLVVDAANGAASSWVRPLFSGLGIQAEVIFSDPDGRNINNGCGATHLDPLRLAVARSSAHLGVALDGDGDRALFVDREGKVITGDHVLFALARYLDETEAEWNRIVVGTVMSNMGLEQALARRGIGFERAGVGDRHVMALMHETGAPLGGEPSGHTIYSPFQPTGDGLLTTLLLIQALGNDPGDAAVAVGREMPWFAQETRNVPVERRRDLESWVALQEALMRFRSEFGDDARILVRNSGTERLVRVMVEAKNPEIIIPTLDTFEALVRKA